MQHELWTRFALAFIRLDSIGVQRVKQVLPATPEPVHVFQAGDHLHRHARAGSVRQRPPPAPLGCGGDRRVAQHHQLRDPEQPAGPTLAPNTDALILASATPHNGRKESFAELVRLLEPTAVDPSGELMTTSSTGSSYAATGKSPKWHRRSAQTGPNDATTALLGLPSQAEDAAARELDEVWLHPEGRQSASRNGAAARRSSARHLRRSVRPPPVGVAQVDEHPTEGRTPKAYELLRRFLPVHGLSFGSLPVRGAACWGYSDDSFHAVGSGSGQLTLA
jgi:hypothetical protein